MKFLLCPKHFSDIISSYPHNISMNPKTGSSSLQWGEQHTCQALTKITIMSNNIIFNLCHSSRPRCYMKHTKQNAGVNDSGRHFPKWARSQGGALKQLHEVQPHWENTSSMMKSLVSKEESSASLGPFPSLCFAPSVSCGL